MKDYAHQVRAYERFKDEEIAALFMEQGTGKSRIAIQLLENHLGLGRITGAILVTTKGLVANWEKVELPKHCARWLDTYVWNETKTEEFSIQNLFLINIDGLLSERFPKVFQRFYKEHPDFMLIVDESTVAKNLKAKRTTRLIQLARRAKIRLIMSGTPITNSPLDLFAQTEILQPELLGHKSIFSFRARYCVMQRMNYGNVSFDKIVGYRGLEELNQKVLGFAEIVKKADCLDLPPKVYRTLPSPLTGRQQEVYDGLVKQALVQIDNNEITAVNAVSLLNKLLQICAGQIKLPDGSYISLQTERLELVRELVDECPGKTLIWTAFVNSAKDLEKRLGNDAIALPSGLVMNQRHDILEQFRHGTFKALIANPASAGHGITLVESANVIYYSNSFNLEHRLQSEDRVHRIGQTQSVLITDLVAPGTVEEKVVIALREKKALADLIITPAKLRELLT